MKPCRGCKYHPSAHEHFVLCHHPAGEDEIFRYDMQTDENDYPACYREADDERKDFKPVRRMEIIL